MANLLLAGFLYTDAGVAINGATVDLFDRNTTTPVRATTTTNANGYWAISHATEGRFDIRITNGSSIRWRKYDTEEQITTLEVANLRVRNPADTFDYDIVPAAITADRILNLPLITGTDTLAVLAEAQTFLTGVKTFNSSILAIRNPADTFKYVFVGGAIVADRNITLPLLTGNDVLVTEAMIQTLTGKTLTSPTIATSPTAAGATWADLGSVTTADINGGTVDSLTSLSIRSTGAAFDLTLATATVFTAGRTLTINPGDAARIITLSGNPTLADWFDQAVKAASSPTFVNLTITSFAANWTNAGRTVADLGIITTVDINGGTVDGVTIGAAAAPSVIRGQDDAFRIENPAASFIYTLTGGAIAANRILNLPVTTATDTVVVATLATQTVPGLLESLIKQDDWTILDMGTAWATVKAGSGDVIARPRELQVTTGATGSSSALARTGANTAWSQGTNSQLINFAKRIVMYFHLVHSDSSGANGRTRVSLGKSNADEVGVLARRGFGFEVQNAALKGIAHDGTNLTTVDLATTVSWANVYRLMLISDGAGNVEWFVNGVSKGTTAAGPSTASGSGMHLQFEAENGADAAAQNDFWSSARVGVGQ